MRAREFLRKSPVLINQYHNHGSLEGYVVDTDQEQLENYLTSQGADQNLIDKLRNQFQRIAILRNLYVDEQNRNLGIGTELLNNAIQDSLYNNAQAALLVSDSAENNEIDLVKWYNELGFNTVGFAGNDPVMVLEL